MRPLLFLAAATFVLGSPPAHATPPRPAPSQPASPSAASAPIDPATRYANLSDDAVLAELARRQIPVERLAAVQGVKLPVRLTGPLHGVTVRSALPASHPSRPTFEILDGRLALALDDFCAILAEHDVVEVVHYTMYRPNVPKPGTPEHARWMAQRQAKADAKLAAVQQRRQRVRPVETVKPLTKTSRSSKRRPKPAKSRVKEKSAKKRKKAVGQAAKQPASSASKPAKRAKKPRTTKKPMVAKSKHTPKAKVKRMLWAPPGTRHPAGMAIDIGYLRKRDGTTLNVAQHWLAHRGAKTCPAPEGDTGSAEMRAIVCRAHAEGLFHSILTPNYDANHRDHFHLEIRPAVTWLKIQ